MGGKDHRNDRSVVGDVEAGVCETFVVRRKSAGVEVSEPRDLVEQSYDESVDGADGASGDVVWAVVSLLADEGEDLVDLVGDYVDDELFADLVDKLIRNL